MFQRKYSLCIRSELRTSFGDCTIVFHVQEGENALNALVVEVKYLARLHFSLLSVVLLFACFNHFAYLSPEIQIVLAYL